jgi:hypothetical protein
MQGQQNQANDKQKVNEGTRHPVCDKSNQPKHDQNPRDYEQHHVRRLSGETLNPALTAGRDSVTSIVPNKHRQEVSDVEFDKAKLCEFIHNCGRANNVSILQKSSSPDCTK